MASRTLSARAWALWLAVAVAAAAALVMPQAAQRVTATVRAHPFVVGHITAQSLSFPPTTAYCQANFGISCYWPAQFQQHYNLDPLFDQGLDGSGRTIVIVDSFGSPTLRHDLHVFDQTFGLLPDPELTIAQPAGPVPPFDVTNGDMVGWAEETTLDVEMAHLMAPGAKLLVLATPVSETEGVQGFPEMVTAMNWAINHHLGDVISQSFGATEETFPGAIHHNAAILGLRSAYKNAAAHGVAVLGASGDAGATDLLFSGKCCYPFRVNSWPSSDPLVTSIGGTQLHLDAVGNPLAPDETWNDGFGAGGGGVSKVFDRPGFQSQVRGIVGSRRGTPDISMSAAVDGGAVVYYSFIGTGFHVFGGTSEASPLFSGIVAIADQIAGERISNLNQRLYDLGRNHAKGLLDVTIGNNSFASVTGFNAGPAYDLATGWGTVDANKFCRQLAGVDNTRENGGDN
jgi:subtilase family serine protease